MHDPSRERGRCHRRCFVPRHARIAPGGARAPCTHPCYTKSEVGPAVRSCCPPTRSTSMVVTDPPTTCVVSTTPR